jgi:thioredoxin-dependent peroxiredoxin
METIILQEGQKAPDFSAKDENGNAISLSDFKGKKLILYFYPKDLTPGCTLESCNLRDNYEDLKNMGFEVVGVSADNEKRHQKFISTFNLPFRLIADTDKKVCTDYGVWGMKKFMGKSYEGITRTTFVIDESGKIEKIITKVNTSSHSKQILDELGIK